MNTTNTTRKAAWEIILEILKERPGVYMACHEIVKEAQARGFYMNENSAASIVCMKLKGAIDGRYRHDKAYKEWAAIPGAQVAPTAPRTRRAPAVAPESDYRLVPLSKVIEVLEGVKSVELERTDADVRIDQAIQDIREIQ
ncbi:hypothetical protein CCP3SC1AL1_110017 [Gammaproteobacteria bacterium]